MKYGSITFATDIDNKNLERNLQKAKKEVEKLEKQLTKQKGDKSYLERQAENITEKWDAASERTDRCRSAFNSAEKKLKEMESAALGAFSPNQIETQKEKVIQLKTQLKDAEKESNSLGNEYKKAAEKADNRRYRQYLFTAVWYRKISD